MTFSSRLALAALGAVAALAFAGAASAADMIGNCEMTGTKGSMPVTTVVPGQVTAEVALPAPGWWNGDTPESIKDGYEYCIAANIAHRAGLDKVEVVNVAWDALVAGQTKNFDLALSEISITDDRKKVVDFSVPYFSSDIGVMAKKGTKVEFSQAERHLRRLGKVAAQEARAADEPREAGSTPLRT